MNCFICTKQAIVDVRHKNRNDVQEVRTLQIQENILRKCNQREDELSRSVQGRLQSCNDLVAEEAVYHRACHQKFLSGGESNPVGRPVNPDSSSAFDKLRLWLESEASTDLLTLSELQSKMEEFSESKETYSTKWLKKKLQDRYCNHLYFAEVNGRKNVVCFKNMVNYIINEQWYEKRRNNVEDEAKRIVATAAKLIREKLEI